MQKFMHGSITEISTTAPHLHAFKVTGFVDDDDLEAMAKHMNHVFDSSGDKVDILIDLSGMTGRDFDGFLDGDVLRAQFRSWSKVRCYAVIAAPERAAKMISWIDRMIPVDARAFEYSEVDAGWAFVGARPVSEERAAADA